MDSFTREQISKGMFSSDQEDYMASLAALPPWKKCASGWHANADPAKCRCGPGPEAPTSMIRVFVRVAPIHVGLYYTAQCSHGTSDRHFAPDAVEGTAGTEKVRQLVAAHRELTGCDCPVEGE